MGLESISWNSVRVFSKLCTGLFRVLYQRTRFGTARRIAYAHSIVGTSDFRTQSHKRCCATQDSPLWVIDYHLNPANLIRRTHMMNPVKNRRLGVRPTTIQVIFDQSPMKLPKWSAPMKST